MRIEPGTYIRSAAMLLAVAAGLAGCGAAAHKDTRVRGNTLTIYESLPLHSASSREADAVGAGAALALSDSHGMAGSHRVNLVELDSSDPRGGPTWDPASVEANAKRAAADPTTIAYIGELDLGGSAISVPVTNDKNILQVSPLDGLTSLTQVDPAAAGQTSPDRYYPNGLRTFMRLVPTDLLQASTLVGWAGANGARNVALVQDEHLFGRELAAESAVAVLRRKLHLADVEEARDDPTGYPDLALKLAQHNPTAVIYTGVGDANAGALLAAIHARLPHATLLGTSALAAAEPAPAGLPAADVLDPVLPPRFYGAAARSVLARLTAQRGAPVGVQALYGYEAMRLILSAIAAAGPDGDDRDAVVRRALEPRLRRSVLGDYRVLASGDVSTARFGAYERSGDGLSFQGLRVPGPAVRSPQGALR